jgi:hypothetical protein
MMDYIISKPNFYSVTYSVNQFQNITLAFSAIGMAICFGLYHFIKEKKKLSWGVTFVNSLITSILSMVYIYRKKREIINYLNNGVGGYDLLGSNDDYSVLCCIWFAVMNIYDLLFGTICYSKYLGLFTAIIHHPFYVWVMFAAVSGKIGFIQVSPFSSGIVFLFVEELPTFVMALGHIFPSFKTHLVYGISFFLLRVCYHIGISYTGFVSEMDLVHVLLPMVPLAMHVYWFKEWLDKYGKKAITF